jgi:hypothetical protein
MVVLTKNQTPIPAATVGKAGIPNIPKAANIPKPATGATQGGSGQGGGGGGGGYLSDIDISGDGIGCVIQSGGEIHRSGLHIDISNVPIIG